MNSQKSFNDEQIKKIIKQNKKIVILFGAVYDLSSYINKHPGGKAIINQYLGKDATQKFVEVGHLTKSRVIEMLSKFRVGSYVGTAKL